MVGMMLQVYAGPDELIRGAEKEIEEVDLRLCNDMRLRRRALAILRQSVVGNRVVVGLGNNRY